MGRSGRTAIGDHLAGLKDALKIEFTIVNCENATMGHGLSIKHAKSLLEAGIDCITLGDHAFDQKDILQFIETEPRILRPMNFSKSAPGRGVGVYPAPRGRKVMVTQVLGQVFMKRPFDDPFSVLDKVLKRHPLGAGQIAASVVDIHCEATGKKWQSGIFVMGVPVPWWAPIPMCLQPMRWCWVVERPIKPMRACAAIIIR